MQFLTLAGQVEYKLCNKTCIQVHAEWISCMMLVSHIFHSSMFEHIRFMRHVRPTFLLHSQFLRVHTSYVVTQSLIAYTPISFLPRFLSTKNNQFILSLVVFVVGFRVPELQAASQMCVAKLFRFPDTWSNPPGTFLSFLAPQLWTNMWTMKHVTWLLLLYFSGWWQHALDNSFNTRVRHDQPGGGVFREYLDLLLGSP